MKRFIPFSNATEALYWFEANCEICKTSTRCTAKRNIEEGFILGDISMKSAEFIGEVNERLFDACQMKDKRVTKVKVFENNLKLEL